jgi:hypothetical protein
MAGSNISRDHIAMEAMKVLMEKTVSNNLKLTGRIKRFFGLNHKTYTAFDEKMIAKLSYNIADAMIAQREKIMEDKL